jgi:ABC-type lipoprotein release transport system permease subunit
VAAVETGATVQKVAVAGGSAEAVRTQDLRKVLRGLREGEVMLGTGLAEATGLGVGDQVTLATRQGRGTCGWPVP